MIYHFVALMQLLLFVTLNAWVILQLSFVHSIFQETHKTLSTKVLFYTAPITAWMMIWHIYGWVWETRWWPSRDRLIHLLPPSMANVTMTKCRWLLEIFVLSTLSPLTSNTLSSHSKTSGRSSLSSSLFQFLPLPHHSYHNLLLYDHPSFLQLLWILSHSPFWRSGSSGPGDRVDLSGSERFVLALHDYQGFPGRLWVFLVEYAPSTSLQFSRLYREHP